METGLHKPGLEGIVATESAICLIDEDKGNLRYRGYDVEDLAEQASFEEVAYLLLKGDLPSAQDLEGWKNEFDQAHKLSGVVRQCLELMPSNVHPMDVLRTGVSLLGMVDPEAHDLSHEANLRKAVRLIASIPLLLSYIVRPYHQKGAVLLPIQGRSVSANVLSVLTGSHDLGKAKELEISMNLYAEHELNASTFAARVTASTLADLYGAATSAIATLKGPLHGGANEAVAQMFMDIGEPEKARIWVRSRLARKERIMGFGHRVLKHEDPRSCIMQQRAKVLSERMGDKRWYQMAEIIDQTMQEEKGLLPNLDFYTAVVYLLLRIPIKTFTPIFVASRMAGWCAHIMEQQDHNRLIRPRASYIGHLEREFLPIQFR
jgi:2-methylcitrate synthase/citrate synthase II